MRIRHVYSFEKLDAIRERRGLTWYRVAKEVGARATTFTPDYFRLHEPKAHRLLDIAHLLGCEVSDFFDVIEQPDSPSGSEKGKPSTTTQKGRPSTAKKKGSS